MTLIRMDTPEAVAYVRAVTVRQALEVHVRTGGRMRLTRIATPRAMMSLASEILGKKFKPRDYEGAIAALTEWIVARQRQPV